MGKGRKKIHNRRAESGIAPRDTHRLDYEEIIYLLRTGRRLCGYLRLPRSDDKLSHIYGKCSHTQLPCVRPDWEGHHMDDCPVYKLYLAKRQRELKEMRERGEWE